MNATPRLALVIPAYNEEETVGAVVRDCLAALPGAEVCVVSDGSSDRTAARAREAGATVLELPCNLGVGPAVQAGLQWARDRGFDLVARLDAERLPPFRDTLLAMIRERGLIDSRVYEAAGIDRRHYSKIRNRADYRPTKTTAVSFAFALRLGIREAERLLRSAGYAFSEASDFDLICSYFIEEGEWDPAEVNDALWAYGQPLVCGAVLE